VSGEEKNVSRNPTGGPEAIDFLIALVVPEDAWYVIPVEAFAPRIHLWLYPREHAGKYQRYREAWKLLGAEVACCVRRGTRFFPLQGLPCHLSRC
jgi:hypothetical protein